MFTTLASDDKNSAQLTFELGCHQLYVVKNYRAAANYFEKAAKKGLKEAQYNLGVLYYEGLGVKKNYQTAVRYYELAAAQGEREAQNSLAVAYQFGEGVEQDEKMAANFYRLASEQGLEAAQYNLALLYCEGEGVEKDEKTAAFYFKLAAKQGNKEAQYALADMYKNGKGVGKDEKTAVRFYQLAAEQGVGDAQYYLAKAYQHGQGIEQNDEKAVHYMQLAAYQGDFRALDNLAKRYIAGRGVVQDLKKAEQLIQQATWVEEKDKFRKFIATKKLDKKVTGSPALKLKISEKNIFHTVTTKGLYEYLLSPEVDASKSYIPYHPPMAKNQRGPTCGLQALDIALAWGNPNKKTPPARKHAIQPLQKEKKKEEKNDSLRRTAKKYGSVMGSVYDIRCLQNTASDHGFETQIIQSNSNTYIQDLIKAIDQNNSLILPVDTDENFPANMKGEGTHYALAWGYLMIDNQYHFLVTQYGKHYLWSAEKLLESHDQLPEKNPLSGEYYKDRLSDTYYQKKKDQIIAKEDLRIEPECTLNHFKYHALAVPHKEKNCLILDKSKEAIDKRITIAVQSSDALALKLLMEARGDEPVKRPIANIQELQEISKINKDPFSRDILAMAEQTYKPSP